MNENIGPNMITRPRPLNFDKVLGALHNRSIYHQQMKAKKIETIETKKEEFTHYRDKANLQFESILPLPDYALNRYKRRPSINTILRDRWEPKKISPKFKEKTVNESIKLPNFQIVETQSNTTSYFKSELDKEFIEPMYGMDRRLSNVTIYSLANESQRATATQKFLEDPKVQRAPQMLDCSDSIIVIPFVADDQLIDVVENQRILEIPRNYLSKFKPDVEVTDLVKYNINTQIIKTITNQISNLFNSTSSKYDFTKTIEENLAVIYTSLVDYENKPVSDLIFKDFGYDILFAIPNYTEDNPYDRNDPLFLKKYYSKMIGMLEKSKEQNLNITSENLMNIVISKNNLKRDKKTNEKSMLKNSLDFRQIKHDKRHTTPMFREKYYFSELINSNPYSNKTNKLNENQVNQKGSNNRYTVATVNRNQQVAMATPQPIRQSFDDSKSKDNHEEKNYTFQNIITKFNISKKLVYEVFSLWNTLIEFYSAYCKEKGLNALKQPFKGRCSLDIINSLFQNISSKSEGYQDRIYKALKLNVISPHTYKLIDFDSFVYLYLIFHKGDYHALWKMDFWESFMDPFGRGQVKMQEFYNHTCVFLSEQHKDTDPFIMEKTYTYLVEKLKNYIRNDILYTNEIKKGFEKNEISIDMFVCYLNGEILF